VKLAVLKLVSVTEERPSVTVTFEEPMSVRSFRDAWAMAASLRQFVVLTR